ncbi:galactose oxidase-like domain-containing protein [Deinococcus cellulosilyticus]|uniref:Uncharacterized protein n=1 Tax=Deinococcus cellulosilyticus (strain DSM 18568 / NBRC 106333 / KACC 11606 / 5516J-15) TaxID=1223518 RepID=A0A511MVV6_DEIC1|nr:galactose oxidase-like domain-containing protein [Deinococcus cellulosilyticus]GEM44715.1 hypothetical protein DC3_03500 [Deinococcus cellulosilyticus NBRC 106333 = KACC 11606]
MMKTTAHWIKGVGTAALLTALMACSSVTTAPEGTVVQQDLTGDESDLARPVSSRAQLGYFTPARAWPLVAVHMGLLPNGNVISWSTSDDTGDNIFDPPSSGEHDLTFVDVWNPRTNVHTRYDNQTGTELFCAGHTLIPDGKVLAAGGHDGLGPVDFYGRPDTNQFDPATNTWTRLPDMQYTRWYPTLTVLPNKEILSTGGVNNGAAADLPEIWNTTTGSWRTLTTASTSVFGGKFEHLYPWMHVNSEGLVFNSGPGVLMGKLNTSGTGSWTVIGQRDNHDRYHGSSVMYQPDRLLVTGGVTNKTPDTSGNYDGSTNESLLVNAVTGAKTAAAPMLFKRSHHQATLLPNGDIFVNGGNSSGKQWDDSTPVLDSEIYRPSTNTWKRAARAAVSRNYHSTSLLLPDGRVLVAGGGIGAGEDHNHRDAEIYYPPYLFNLDGTLAARPGISYAPSKLGYNQVFPMTMNSSAAVSRVTLIRFGFVTHSFNLDQRFQDLKFAQGSYGQLSVLSPLNNKVAPPGHYMLFALNSKGVPSAAKIINIQ